MSHITGHLLEEIKPLPFENNQEKNLTGTQIGNKFAQDMNVIGGTVGVSLDLSDKITNFKLYDVDNFETVGLITYILYSELSGKWFLKRVDESAGTIRYASLVNNPLEDFTSAWTNRATLVYSFRKDIVSGL